MLTIQELTDANVRRTEQDFNHKLEDWSLMEWGSAAAGEQGEANNVAKKIKRLLMNLGHMNNREDQNLVSLKERLGEEIADSIIYEILWLKAAGLDPEEVIRRKFNITSAKHGSPIRL